MTTYRNKEKHRLTGAFETNLFDLTLLNFAAAGDR